MDFADPSHSRTRPKGVGYRFCFVGRAIGSGWQGPLQFQGMGAAPPQRKDKAWKGLGRGMSKPRHRDAPFDCFIIEIDGFVLHLGISTAIHSRLFDPGS
jgi:hypothetical protein